MNKHDNTLAQISAARINPDAMLDVAAVGLLLGGKSPQTVYRYARCGTLPRPVTRGRWHGGSIFKCLEQKAMAS